MGLHHKLCHVLGGTFGLPHAETHAVVLPHVLALNAPYAAAAVTDSFGDCLGTGTGPATFLHDLAYATSAPTSLAELGLARTDIDRAADMALATPYPNPGPPLTGAAVRAILLRAWAGAPPGVQYPHPAGVPTGRGSATDRGRHRPWRRWPMWATARHRRWVLSG